MSPPRTFAAPHPPRQDPMNELRTLAANRARRRLRAIWVSRGGGFYGFVVLLTFVYLEVLDVGGDIAALPGAEPGLGFVIRWLVGNLVDAILNTVRAAVWPLSWVSHFGVGLRSAALLAGSYAGYRLLRPTVIRWLTPTDEATIRAEQTLA
jgi:hypothetical protein